MPFKLEAPNATLENLNLRTEREGEDHVPATDLKFTCESDDKMAGFLMGALEDGDIPPLWREDDNHREKRYHGIEGNIASKAEFEDCLVRFKDVAMKGVKVNKFSFEPISGGKIRLTLRVQLRPNDKELVKLSHYQRKGGKLTISTDDEFDLNADNQPDLV